MADEAGEVTVIVGNEADAVTLVLPVAETVGTVTVILGIEGRAITVVVGAGDTTPTSIESANVASAAPVAVASAAVKATDAACASPIEPTLNVGAAEDTDKINGTCVKSELNAILPPMPEWLVQ